MEPNVTPAISPGTETAAPAESADQALVWITLEQTDYSLVPMD